MYICTPNLTSVLGHIGQSAIEGICEVPSLLRNSQSMPAHCAMHAGDL